MLVPWEVGRRGGLDVRIVFSIAFLGQACHFAVSRLTLLGSASMPNGHREPYRFVGLRRILDSGDEADAPSPCHTSDSEETWEAKRKFKVASARVRLYARLWKRRARSLRRARQLYVGRLLPARLAGQEWIYVRLASFL